MCKSVPQVTGSCICDFLFCLFAAILGLLCNYPSVMWCNPPACPIRWCWCLMHKKNRNRSVICWYIYYLSILVDIISTFRLTLGTLYFHILLRQSQLSITSMTEFSQYTFPLHVIFSDDVVRQIYETKRDFLSTVNYQSYEFRNTCVSGNWVISGIWWWAVGLLPDM